MIRAAMQAADRVNAPWSDDDRKWFAKNQARAHRLRFSFAGEWPEGQHTVVRQLAPGCRLRLPFLMTGPDLDEELQADEKLACALFEAALTRKAYTAEEFAHFRREH